MGVPLEKYVRIGFVVAGILVWAVAASLFGTLFQWIAPNWDKMLLGAQFTVSTAIGALFGIGTGIALWLNPAVLRLGVEIANELRNVTWPTWQETRVSTIVVLVTTVVVAAILGLFDAVWGSLSAVIYRL